MIEKWSPPSIVEMIVHDDRFQSAGERLVAITIHTCFKSKKEDPELHKVAFIQKSELEDILLRLEYLGYIDTSKGNISPGILYPPGGMWM